jgi:hypothetical protein
MSNITEEEVRNIIVGFIKHVFEEVQTEGWKTRRNEFLIQYELESEIEVQEVADEFTFNRAMEHYGGDVDEVILEYLYPILTSFGWIEAWMYHLRDDLGGRIRGLCYWNIWDDLDEILYTMKPIWIDNQFIFQKKKNLSDVKEILELDFDLK